MRLIDADALKQSFEDVMVEERPVSLRLIVGMIDAMPTLTDGARNSIEKKVFDGFRAKFAEAVRNPTVKKYVPWTLYQMWREWDAKEAD